MAFLVGALLALRVGLMATAVGLDRDRAFYPTVTIVVGSYYALVRGHGRVHAGAGARAAGGLGLPRLSTVVFPVVALGRRGSPGGPRRFDFGHDGVVSNPGVPAWWPAFCLAYDVAAAAYLAWLLTTGRVRAATLTGSQGTDR